MSRLSRLFFIFVIVGSILPSKPGYAVSGYEWRAGNIIDDNVFYNNADMTVAEIQTFLNSRVPNCTTGYTCLKSYVENPYNRQNNIDTGGAINGGWGSAFIIKNAADTYNISPRALLAILQKESSLVTRTSPTASVYSIAMGYACPDTAPCDSEYYGFSNQITNAARQFRLYANNPQSYRYKPYVSNDIYYNPRYSCGKSSVYLENKATAGLYNYTPYQPNQPALNNLYGEGDSCSAYGNRNFWRIFNDWFGRTSFTFGSKASSSSVYANSPCIVPSYTPSHVGRLYNPDTLDYLFTTNRQEACEAIRLGYIWDDIAFNNDDGKPDKTPVYRLRMGKTHSYTSSSTEFSQLLSYGFVNEGVVFYGLLNSGSERLPVYMLGQGAGSTSSRVLTSAGDEGTYFVSSLNYESRGVGLYTSTNNSQGIVYRLRRQNDRFYTTSLPEANSAIQYYGYTSEGFALKSDTRPGQYSRPVYRLNGPGGRLYTTNRTERDTAVIDYRYTSEGSGFYGYAVNLAATSPVYRSTNYVLRTRLYTPYEGEYYNSQTHYGYRTEGISWYGLP